jgi:hypothetical protein
MLDSVGISELPAKTFWRTVARLSRPTKWHMRRLGPELSQRATAQNAEGRVAQLAEQLTLNQ